MTLCSRMSTCERRTPLESPQTTAGSGDGPTDNPVPALRDHLSQALVATHRLRVILATVDGSGRRTGGRP